MYQNNNRAAQFMPFNGLRGFTDLIHEAETPKVPQQELTEDQAFALNEIVSKLKKGDFVKITYYTASGYISQSCTVLEVNPPLHYILTNQGCFSFNVIREIEII